MNCSRCRTENLDDSLFCTECGGTLERPCAGCGASNPPEAKFCRKCGIAAGADVPAEREPRDYTPRHLVDKILNTKSAIEGELKQLTVLFADVKGSMDLAESVHPETWHQIMDGFFSVLTEGVHRFEGTINQYTGDGIMALFGAPIAHEDHAQRACYASLQLRDDLAKYAREVKRKHGLGFSVRMGIHSGEVVVGSIGDDLRMDYTAQGHAVGLAARMEDLASPDTIYLTGAAAALVSGYLDLEDLGEFNLKGVAAPVQVHQLLGMGKLRTRFDVARSRGLSRFVGRDDDMQTLERALASARAGNGQVLGVVADAGIGKSRLCFEFLERCRSEGLQVMEGHAVAHGKNIPFLPVLQVFRGYFGINEHDTDQQAREKIAGRMLLIDESFREALPVLFDFLGVPDPARPAPQLDAEARQRQLFSMVRHLMEGSDPFVTMVEDLHWLDPGSEAFIEDWTDVVAGTKGLLLVNFRPEYHADWMQKSWYQQLPLRPLGPEAIRELLADQLGADPSTNALADTIHERTGGNPFFAEEVVLSCIESGHLAGTRGAYKLVTPIERLEVPGTVQALLASRIDRLVEREKAVLQTAAVIGKEFIEPILEAVVQLSHSELSESLRLLKTSEFIYEQALYPVVEYAFKHPLTQEVALHSQLQEHRRRIHASVAEAIEKTSADKLDEQAALLAHHWEEAGEPVRAASWHAVAAEWAGTNSPDEAERHWRSARTLLDSVPTTPETIPLATKTRIEMLNFGWRQGMSDEEAEQLLDEGLKLTDLSGDTAQRIRVISTYAAVRFLTGAPAAVVGLCQENQVVAAQLGDAESSFAALAMLSSVDYMLGRLEHGEEVQAQLVALARQDSDLGVDSFGVSASWLGFGLQGMYCLYRGRLGEVDEWLDRCEMLAREKDELEVLAWTAGVRSLAAEVEGNAQLALSHARQMSELVERTGSSLARVFGFVAHGYASTAAGEYREAVDLLEEGLRLARETRALLTFDGELGGVLARAYVGLGEFDRALEVAREAVAVSDRRQTQRCACVARLGLSRALRAAHGKDAIDEIESVLERLAQDVIESGAAAFMPQLHEERGELALLREDYADFDVEFQLAHERAVEIGAETRAARLAERLESEAAAQLERTRTRTRERE